MSKRITATSDFEEINQRQEYRPDYREDYLVNSILENTRTSLNELSDGSSEELATFSDEESATSSNEDKITSSDDPDFHSIYSRLFTQWMSLHK